LLPDHLACFLLETDNYLQIREKNRNNVANPYQKYSYTHLVSSSRKEFEYR
ncbi:1471_t:CDS:2, partial [Diversispora eburnea]